jgi:AraC-like DNA-binding protein
MTDRDQGGIRERGLLLLRDAIYGGALVTEEDRALLTEALRHSGLRLPFWVVAVQPEGREVRPADKRVRALELHPGLQYWCIPGDPARVTADLERRGVLHGAPQPCPAIDKLLGAIRTSVVDIRFKELPKRHPVALTPAELADEPKQRAKLLNLIAQDDPAWREQARHWTALVSVRHLRSLNNFRRKLVELLAQLSRVHEDKDLGHVFFLLMQRLYACHTYRGLEQLFPDLLASLIGRLAKGRTGDLSRARSEAVKAAASFVRGRFREPISLADAAAAAGVSGAHLARAWRKEIGCSVGDALRGLRLGEARRLLADGNRTVLDVALTCGFGSVEHFHRTFRAHQGSSPDAWRRAVTDDGA